MKVNFTRSSCRHATIFRKLWSVTLIVIKTEVIGWPTGHWKRGSRIWVRFAGNIMLICVFSMDAEVRLAGEADDPMRPFWPCLPSAIMDAFGLPSRAKLFPFAIPLLPSLEDIWSKL